MLQVLEVIKNPAGAGPKLTGVRASAVFVLNLLK